MHKTVRWKICFLMFLGILINYLDRVNISQAIIEIPKSFVLSGAQKGWVLSAFGVGYVAMMMAGGYFVFRLGARAALTVSTILLALTSIACGLSTSFIMLLVLRFFIGVFEAPVYPAFASIAGIWFPKKERVKAIGFFDIGSYAGIAFATLVIVYIIANYGWRASFMFSGMFTLLWSAVWFFYYRDAPAAHPYITPAEVTTIGNNVTQQTRTKGAWLKYIGHRKVIGISIGFFCFNYLKSFYLTWLPTYMVETKGIKLLAFGVVGSLPLLFAIAAELFTAYTIDRLIAKGYPATYVKKLPVCIGMLLSTIIAFSLFTTSVAVIVVLLTLSYIFLLSASVSIWSIPEELAQSKKDIAIIGSIQNTFSNIAGIVAPIATGYMYNQTGSFLWPFMVSVAISVIGAFSYWKVVGKLSFITFKNSPAVTYK